MKITFVALLFTASALAQVPSVAPLAACGPGNVSFKVDLVTTDSQAQPAPGKALVYFIHDAGSLWSMGYPTTKEAIDGAWVGANHGDSYFSVSVDPGEHHLCAALQTSLAEDRQELAHFTAEAGKIYYFRTRLFWSERMELLTLEPIDSDQGKYLIATYQLSISQPKK